MECAMLYSAVLYYAVLCCLVLCCAALCIASIGQYRVWRASYLLLALPNLM